MVFAFWRPPFRKLRERMGRRSLETRLTRPAQCSGRTRLQLVPAHNATGSRCSTARQSSAGALRRRTCRRSRAVRMRRTGRAQRRTRCTAASASAHVTAGRWIPQMQRRTSGMRRLSSRLNNPARPIQASLRKVIALPLYSLHTYVHCRRVRHLARCAGDRDGVVCRLRHSVASAAASYLRNQRRKHGRRQQVNKHFSPPR